MSGGWGGWGRIRGLWRDGGGEQMAYVKVWRTSRIHRRDQRGQVHSAGGSGDWGGQAASTEGIGGPSRVLRETGGTHALGRIAGPGGVCRVFLESRRVWQDQRGLTGSAGGSRNWRIGRLSPQPSETRNNTGQGVPV